MYDMFEEGMFSVDRRRLPAGRGRDGAHLDHGGAPAVVRDRGHGVLGCEVGVSGAFFVALIASLMTAVPFPPAGVGLVEIGIVFVLH